MRTLRQIRRTAGAVFALISCFALLKAAECASDSGAVQECTSIAGTAVNIESNASEAKFKCAAAYQTFLPSDATKVYTGNKPTSSTAPTGTLASLVADAKLTKANDVYTLKIPSTATVAEEKTFYYLCEKTAAQVQSNVQNERDGAKEYCPLTITVKPRKAATPVPTCNSGDGADLLLLKDQNHIQFVCGDEYPTLVPSNHLLTYTGSKLEELALTALYPEASLSVDGTNKKLFTLAVPRRTQTKFLYYRCKKDETNFCDVRILVEKNAVAPPAYDFDAVTCTKEKKSLTVTLSAESPAAVFACAVDFPIFHPTDLTKTYTTSAMNTEVSLNTLFKKAVVQNDPSEAALTYFLYIPYRDTAQTLYYNCKNRAKSETCTVTVKVESNKDVIPVCRDSARGAILTYEDFSESVKFKCDSTYPTIVPSNIVNVYIDDPVSNPSAKEEALSSIYSGASLVSDGHATAPTFTLTIPQHLPRKDRGLYYKCQKADKTACLVRIGIVKKEPQLNTCTAGKDQKVKITAPGEVFKFKCDTSLNLLPADPRQVYDNQDDKCSVAANLTDLVPKATIADDTEAGGKVLTFTELPAKEQALCYSCQDSTSAAAASGFLRAPQAGETCKVMINVKSAAQGLAAQTLAGHAFILVGLAGALFSAL